MKYEGEDRTQELKLQHRRSKGNVLGEDEGRKQAPGRVATTPYWSNGTYKTAIVMPSLQPDKNTGSYASTKHGVDIKGEDMRNGE